MYSHSDLFNNHVCFICLLYVLIENIYLSYINFESSCYELLTNIAFVLYVYKTVLIPVCDAFVLLSMLLFIPISSKEIIMLILPDLASEIFDTAIIMVKMLQLSVCDVLPV